MYWHESADQQTMKETMRIRSPLGEKQRIVVSGLHSDTEGKRVAFSAHISLPLGRDVVQLGGVTWYSVVDVVSRKLIISGPRQTEVPRRVQDHVIGWSHDRVVIVRKRLLHAGSAWPEDVDEHYKVLDTEVNVITISDKGDEQLIHRYTCPNHPALRPAAGARGYLGNFLLCQHQDCLVFTEDKVVFGKDPSPVRRGKWLTVPKFAESKQVVHRLHLRTGRDEVLGETPVGWRCKDIWCDCQSGRVIAIVSSEKEERVLGIASLREGASQLRVLGQFKDAWRGSISPDGKLAVFVNGDADEDVSEAKVVRAEAPSALVWKGVVPCWRREATWSGDSRKITLWRSVWFHDKEHGSRYERLYQGYRFWVVDVVNKGAHAVGPKWAGLLAVTWGADSKGLFVIANGTLGCLNIDTGELSFIWAFPLEWYKMQ